MYGKSKEKYGAISPKPKPQAHGSGTHSNKLAAKDVERFLSHLATEGKVAASTQRQALNALAFIYREVLDRQLDDISRVNGEIPIASWA
ncbi:phage integrase N-terminal SAM-like domain-containing protein [Desulfobulbus sp.]|uniref:phage integrase N-terminal SAM-like domain-containing protein n=1 Tax=Desulfobulbus sp. TaxID=895 RepID=UPI00359F9BC5